MTRTTPTRSALVFSLSLLVATVAAPAASAGPLVEDVLEGEEPTCPTPLIPFIICYATQNPLVRRLVEEGENQTRILVYETSNFTEDRAQDAWNATDTFVHAADRATGTYSGETGRNAQNFSQAAQATASDNVVFARDTVNGECRFYTGITCVTSIGSAQANDAGEGDGSFLSPNANCTGDQPVIPYLVCRLYNHYSNVANDTNNQTWETYNRVVSASFKLYSDQYVDTVIYAAAMDTARSNYQSALVVIKGQVEQYSHEVVAEECTRLVDDPCPLRPRKDSLLA